MTKTSSLKSFTGIVSQVRRFETKKKGEKLVYLKLSNFDTDFELIISNEWVTSHAIKLNDLITVTGYLRTVQSKVLQTRNILS